MINIKQKSDQVKWLKEVGITYYCSDKKDSVNSWNALSTALTTTKKVITDNQLSLSVQEDMNKQQLSVTVSNDTDAVLTARKIADSAIDLADLRQKLLDFDGCNLKKFANKTVFSDGNPLAKILLLGEAPGANEDLQGIPFCGESGKLLDNMLATIDVSREKNAYITNTVFWRPPANRPPTEQEIEICRPFVEKHIALINPAIIILVGSTAATSLLGKHDGISKIRQNNYSYSNRYLKDPIYTTAIYHPAYLLRQPFQKKSTWFDLIRIQQYISTLKINSL
jgi:DNA polymerase